MNTITTSDRATPIQARMHAVRDRPTPAATTLRPATAWRGRRLRVGKGSSMGILVPLVLLAAVAVLVWFVLGFFAFLVSRD